MKKKSTFVKDFKAFITKGNVLDMAVGVIIGGAFSSIVSSLVNDIIMPALGLLVGEVNFTDLKIVLRKAVEEGQADVTLNYGQFIQYIFNFLLIALCIFAAIRFVSNLSKKLKKEEEKAEEAAPAPAPEPEPSKEEVLLTEIRDLLKNKK